MNDTLIRDLQAHLGYPFADPDLLRLALTHSSVSAANYERLEHLGDAVLDLAVTTWLYHTFPRFGPGQMSVLRAELVRAPALARFARQLDLPDAVHLSRHAAARGFRHRTSILSDVFEAVVGAIFVDAGTLDPVARVLRPLIEPPAHAAMYRDPAFYRVDVPMAPSLLSPGHHQGG